MTNADKPTLPLNVHYFLIDTISRHRTLDLKLLNYFMEKHNIESLKQEFGTTYIEITTKKRRKI